MDRLRGIEESIRANRQAFEATAAQRRGDPAGLKEAFDKAMARHSELRQQHHDAVTETREQLVANASRMPASSGDAGEMNQRDALSRASSAKTFGELRRFVEDAQRAGDRTAVKAGVHAAVSRGLTGILASVADDPAVDALMDFENAYGDQATAAAKFARSVALSAPAMPGRMR